MYMQVRIEAHTSFDIHLGRSSNGLMRQLPPWPPLARNFRVVHPLRLASWEGGHQSIMRMLWRRMITKV